MKGGEHCGEDRARVGEEEEEEEERRKCQTCWCCYERMASVPQSNDWQVRPRHLCQKEKKLSRLSKSPVREMEPHLKDKKGSQAEAWRGKSRLNAEKKPIRRRRGRACKENHSRKSRRKYEQVSGRKSSVGGSGGSWFHSKSGQT